MIRKSTQKNTKKVMKTISKDVDLLKAYLQHILRWEKYGQHLCPWDLGPPSEGTLPTVSERTECVARLADANDFDGSLFRDFDLMPYKDKLSRWWWRNLRKQKQTVPRIIAAIEKPVDREAIPDGAELLTVPQVACILQCAESVVRQRDKDGLIPKPIRIGGVLKWRKKEIYDWLDAGCPNRQVWERQKKAKGGN